MEGKEGTGECSHYFVIDDGGDYVDCGPISEHPSPPISEAMVGKLIKNEEAHRFFMIDRSDSYIYVSFGVSASEDEDKFVWVAGNKIPDELKQREDEKVILVPPPIVSVYPKKIDPNSDPFGKEAVLKWMKRVKSIMIAAGYTDPRIMAKLFGEESNPLKRSFSETEASAIGT